MKPHISWFEGSAECCLFKLIFFFNFITFFRAAQKWKTPTVTKSLTSKILFHSKISQMKYWKNSNVDHCSTSCNKEQKTCYGGKKNVRKSRNKHHFFFFLNGDQEILKYVLCRPYTNSNINTNEDTNSILHRETFIQRCLQKKTSGKFYKKKFVEQLYISSYFSKWRGKSYLDRHPKTGMTSTSLSVVLTISCQENMSNSLEKICAQSFIIMVFHVNILSASLLFLGWLN